MSPTLETEPRGEALPRDRQRLAWEWLRRHPAFAEASLPALAEKMIAGVPVVEAWPANTSARFGLFFRRAA